MHSASSPRRPFSSTISLWLLIISAILFWTPTVGQCGRSSTRGIMRRVRAIQAKQKQKSVQTLQAELSAAQNALSQAETEFSSASPALQAAKSELDTAKERVDAKEKELHDAMKKHHELEAQLMASQTPDSPVGKAQTQLNAAEVDLDAQVHRILSLPPHTNAVTEADRAQEWLELSDSQKHRLKEDASYHAAFEKVEAMRTHLAEQRKLLFENDPGWKASHDERQGLSQDLKALEENRKTAAMEVAVNLKKVKAAQAMMVNAQQVIMISTSQLKALGASPKTPAKK